MNTFAIAILLTILVCCISSLPNGNQRTATNRNSPETVSQRKCKEFSEIQDEDTRPLTCPFDYWNSFPDNRAGPYEFPHLVLLGYQSDRKPDDIQWACTGNLISDQYVVTEAHCLVSPQGSPTYVRMGVSSVNDTQDRQEFNVEEVIVHPDYSKRSYYNDIGLVKLDKKAKLNSKVKPICLPSESVPDNKDIISAGFDLRGSLDSIRTENVIKYTIKKLNVDVCNNNEAYKTNRRFTKGGLDNSQLCIGVSKEDDKLCNEGSGWAAQIDNDKVFCTYQLISMAAFGKPCTSSEDPSVHTNVLPFVQWIESIVWPEDQINNDNDDTINFPS